ncbi:MAG TPA: hypothetical protein P5191_05180 [Ruminococcus sp.]|nr:hypothetical protein [Ruminococcus sp.]
MKRSVPCLAALAALAVITSCGKSDSGQSSTASGYDAAAVTTEAGTETQSADTTAANDQITIIAENEKNSGNSEDIKPIAGTWYEENALDPRVLTISGDGSFELAYRGGGARLGTVKLESTETTDGSTQECYNLYQNEGELYASFPKNTASSEELEDHLVSIQGEEQFSFSRTPSGDAAFSKAEDTANEYGFYPYTEDPREGAASIAVIDIEGEWITGQFAFSVFGCDRLNGRFIAETEGGNKEGYVKLEYTLEDNDSKQLWYNFYADDGSLYKSFRATDDIPVNVLYDEAHPSEAITRKAD